jgi:hypothetical protein
LVTFEPSTPISFVTFGPNFAPFGDEMRLIFPGQWDFARIE